MRNFTKLISSCLIACAGVAFAQGSANSGNKPSTTNNGYYFDFNGVAADNCTAKIPYDQWFIPTAYTPSFANSKMTVTTTGAQEGWHRLNMRLTNGDCQDATISIGANQNVEFVVESSVAVPQCILWFIDNTVNVADNEPVVTALTVGTNTISVSNIDFGKYNGGNTPTVYIDSTNIIAVGLSFRNSDGDNGATIPSIAGTFSIPYIKIGDQTGLVSSTTDASELEASIKVFPSPATSNLRVNFKADESSKVTLFDATGNAKIERSCNAGEQELDLDVESLPAGLYHLNINAGGKVATRKVMVE
jgi:hypothetical protein